MVEKASKPIEAGWNDFREKVLEPAGAGAVQIQETRRAFYAGASHLFKELLKSDEGEEVTANDLRRLDAIDEEFKAFQEGLLRGMF
jgi:hypothetical protein